MTKAIAHVNFAASMCQEQAKSGRLFLFEHPARATSWKLDSLCELLEVVGVTSVLGDMCSHGMTQSDSHGRGFVKKTTRFMTNSNHIAKAVGVRCPKNHRHITLVDGRPKAAAIYPEGLCQAICQGYVNHMKDNVQESPVLAHSPQAAEVHENRTWDIDHVTMGGINAVTSGLEEHLELAICEEVGEPFLGSLGRRQRREAES